MYGAPTGDKLVGPFGDGELTIAGDTIRVFNIHVLAFGTTAPVTSLLSGGAGGTVQIKETGTASTGKTFDYGVNGKLFTNGCWVAQLPTNGSTFITFRKELA